MIRVLSMDPGVTNIGYSIIDEKIVAGVSILELVDFGAFTVGSELEKFNHKMDQESYRTYRKFESLYNKYVPTNACWEIPPSFGAMSQQSRILSNVSMFKALAWRFEVEVSSITPVGMKNALTGNGRASKADIKNAVEKIFPQLVGTKWPPDVYDAIGVGVTIIQGNKWKKFVDGE